MIRTYRTDESRRLTSQDRRNTLRAANRCINGPLVGEAGHRGVAHGHVVAGGKCQHCVDVAYGRIAA